MLKRCGRSFVLLEFNGPHVKSHHLPNSQIREVLTWRNLNNTVCVRGRGIGWSFVLLSFYGPTGGGALGGASFD